MLHLVLGGVLLAGCIGETADGAAAPVGGTTDRLANTLTLPMEAGSCRAQVTIDDEVKGGSRERIELEVLDGAVGLRTRPDGVMEIETLDVHLGDVAVDTGQRSTGDPRVTGITLTLRDVAEAASTVDAATAKIRASGEVDLLLDWDYVTTTGQQVPLGTQTLTGVAVDIEVTTTDDGKALLKLRATRDGQFVDAPGLFTLSDLGLELRGVG